MQGPKLDYNKLSAICDLVYLLHAVTVTVVLGVLNGDKCARTVTFNAYINVCSLDKYMFLC